MGVFKRGQSPLFTLKGWRVGIDNIGVGKGITLNKRYIRV
jgi:hypothetical protein